MKYHTRSIWFGLLTILCWGSLATFGKLLVHLPPFYVLGVSFLIGSIPAWFHPREMFPRPKILVWGVAGYFGYHFCLFYSFRYAPAIEANLINYLWPVILVILSPVFFTQMVLKWHHIAGAVLAVLGSFILVMGETGEPKMEYLPGYLLALGAALSWPLYSIGKKKMPATPIWAVGGFCFISSLLCFLTHSFIEPRVVLQTHDLYKLIYLGLGPFGLAFYAWDYALRVGDSRVMGALSYLTPVLSTLGLVLFTEEKLLSHTMLAMVLIIGGASLGLLDFLRLRR